MSKTPNSGGSYTRPSPGGALKKVDATKPALTREEKRKAAEAAKQPEKGGKS